ncbi:38878_t:CDS:1, partial [Gigaspora margarita]
TLLVFDKNDDNSIYNCFDNYYMDCTLHSKDDFGLILLFKPSTAVAFPYAKNVNDSTFEISSSDDEPDNSP